MDRIVRLSLLYDFYADLLTDKQKLFYELHYLNDLSLNEIAEEQNISPQAVWDLIKRTEKILNKYEQKLNLIEKFEYQKEKISLISNYIENNFNSEVSSLLKNMLQDILQQDTE